jgi:hypothetical protein
VLTADSPHHATLDEVLAQLGERPSAKRQSHVAGRGLSQAQDLGGLLGRDADWRPASQALPHTGDAELCEGPQVRVYGVNMDLKRASNLGRLQASGVQHDGLSTAPLPRREIVFQHGVELSNFNRSRLARLQRSRHGWTSYPRVAQPY